ncbi:MAG: hemerythrin domain-containing protein [Crocinitomicaceae bacterium]|nr:hemerythrin domain-containing protein [Crocinitomicaceae bacterium]
MSEKKPLKRSEFLIRMSHDHHDGLLLCWKIRSGIQKKVETERIKKYVDWFFENQLLPHFEMEEQDVFPVLGNEHELVKKALSEHRRLIRLFQKKDEVLKTLSIFEEELESHIRFEERVLFQEIQEVASEEQQAQILKKHASTGGEDCKTWNDPFWEKVKAN